MAPNRLAALTVALVFAVACGSSTPSSNNTGGGPALAGKRWCVSTPGAIGVLDQMFNNMVAAAAADGNGLQIDFVSGNFDLSKQLSDTAQFVASGNCAAIGTITSISSQTQGAWKKTADDAKAKNIVYVNFSADWVTDATQNFGNPHYPAGNLVGLDAGKWYAAHGGTGSVGVLVAPQSPGLMQRVKGFEDGFKSASGNSNITFNEVAVPNGDVTGSANATASLIQAHHDLKVMFGWGGDTWQGIMQAGKEAGKTTNNFYAGADDLPDAAINLFAKGSNGLLQGGTEFDYSLAGVAWERSVEWAL
ncbi:MAG TPA: sugar ABC transporter substrate-binding protein, partial [Candidatus Dormibacteraeota bacterium]